MITNHLDFTKLSQQIRQWGEQLGFQQIEFSDIDLGQHVAHLQNWLQQGHHGDMTYMENNQSLRAHPDQLLPDARVIITARMNYLPPEAKCATILNNPDKAYVSRYALGRDYHKLIRKRLAQLAEKITDAIGPFQHRAFVDSAPVLERALAEKSGQGWIGKNTLLLNQQAGSWFFLGEILTTLPADFIKTAAATSANQCGNCSACLTICPTQAFIGPYQLDARRCISYLTIEHAGSIPTELRPLLGNRIYGCDDCQLICPWNRFSSITQEQDFHPRQQLDDVALLTLFSWTEAEFLHKTEGSPIRRIGHERWQRNIAVALGNAPYNAEIVNALQQKITLSKSLLVIEHCQWALQRQQTQHTVPNNPKLIRTIVKMHPRDA